MKKNFEHQKKEICGLCDKEIDTSKDNWVSIIDFEKQKNTKTKFYHRGCLDDLVKGKGKVIQQKFEDKVGALIKKMFGSADLSQTQFGMNLRELSA